MMKKAYPLILLMTAILLAPIAISVATEERAAEHDALIAKIEAGVRLTRGELGRNHLHPNVIKAMRDVPRHEFVPQSYQRQSYFDRPIPIGHGQTISQPYIVAIMTDLIDPEPGDKVFELGTGSGYQAAVLSRIVDKIYSMEIVEPLGKQAKAKLKQLGYDNIEVTIGDGYHGRPDVGPFDAIVVTAAGDHIPPPLVRQLKPGGKMIIPVGSSFFTQQLMLVTKGLDGSVGTQSTLPVRFVPLTGKH